MKDIKRYGLSFVESAFERAEESYHRCFLTLAFLCLFYLIFPLKQLKIHPSPKKVYENHTILRLKKRFNGF